MAFASVGLSVLVLTASGPAAGQLGEPYPTAERFDPEGILDADSWDLFTDIGGFDRNPNASGDRAGVVLQLNATDGSFIVSLESEELAGYDEGGPSRNVYLVTVACASIGLGGDVRFNATASRTPFVPHSPSDGATYHVTAFVDAGGGLQVLWERIWERFDVPSYYWLFHEIIDPDGNVTQSGHLFYLEKWGGYMEPPRDYRWIIVVGAAATVAAIAGVIRWRSRTRGLARREPERREP